MKLILSIALFTFLLHPIAQEDEGAKKYPKASYGFNLGPAYSSILTNQPTYLGSRTFSGPGVSIGFRAEIQFLDWIGLQTGLDILGYGNYYDQDTVSGPVVGIDYIYYQNQIYTYETAIPLIASFNVGKKKAKFHAGVGFLPSFMILTHSVTKYTRPDGSTYTQGVIATPNSVRFNLYSTISAGFRYDASEKFSFILEPNFKLGLLPLIKNAPSGNIHLRYLIGLDFTFLFGKG
jgi:hypothetical protein